MFDRVLNAPLTFVSFVHLHGGFTQLPSKFQILQFFLYLQKLLILTVKLRGDVKATIKSVKRIFSNYLLWKKIAGAEFSMWKSKSLVHKLRVASCKFSYTSYEFRFTSYKLNFTSYKFKLQIASLNTQFTSSNPRVTSSNL